MPKWLENALVFGGSILLLVSAGIYGLFEFGVLIWFWAKLL